MEIEKHYGNDEHLNRTHFEPISEQHWNTPKESQRRHCTSYLELRAVKMILRYDAVIRLAGRGKI